MRTPLLSASFCQKRRPNPRPSAISQPAPKELRFGFRPVLHAHPAFYGKKVPEKKNTMPSHQAFLEDILSQSFPSILALVPLLCRCLERRCDNMVFQFLAASRPPRLRMRSGRSFLSLPCVMLLCPGKLLYAYAWLPLWNQGS